MIMGWFGKAVLYTGLFAAGFGVCYGSCVDRQYKVLRNNGELLVMDRSTGRMAEVDDDFCTQEELRERNRDIGDRIEDAYQALTR
jgi:hypothetical protein